MANQILVDATYLQQELRVVVAVNGIVEHLDVEAVSKQQTKAYIYKGKITRIEPSLEACFVDYGAERHGFLPLKDISPEYFSRVVGEDERPSIRDLLQEGQELVVQVEKIERGKKGAALTTYITLAGSFLVLMPNTPKAGGVSRRIDGSERSDLLDILRQLSTPEEMGIIIRTASVGRSLAELQWDLDILVHLWGSIKQIAATHSAPLLIHQESNAMIRALRDYLRQDIDEIIVNELEAYTEAKKYIELIRPDFVEKIKFYEEAEPLFSRYKIEEQVSGIYQRQIRLPSGGSLAIDQTEALVSIDINSSKATKGGDIEETALQTNLEAADEIAKQLRLRDIGGLIVIDFIDMMQSQNQRAVEDRLRDAVNNDRAKIQTGKISRFGLLEMSRQRLRSAFSETSKIVCPHCQGQGIERSIPSIALTILRAIEERVGKESASQVRVHVPIEVAAYLLNEQRTALQAIEARQKTQVVVVPHVHLDAPNFEIECLQAQSGRLSKPSYRLALEFKNAVKTGQHEIEDNAPTAEHAPAIKHMALPEKPRETAPIAAAPQRQSHSPKKKGIIATLLSKIFGNKKESQETAQSNAQDGRRHYNNRNGGQGNRRYNNNRRPSGSNSTTGNAAASGGRRPYHSNNRGGSTGGQRRPQHNNAGNRPPRSDADSA